MPKVRLFLKEFYKMNKSTVLSLIQEWEAKRLSGSEKLMPDNHYLYCFDNAGFPYSENQKKQSFSEHWIFVKD